MERREYEMTGFGEFERHLDFQSVSHFPEKYYLRILTHRTDKGSTIVRYVSPDFLLFYDGFFV